MSNGWVSTSLFFLLSGFILAYLYWGEEGQFTTTKRRFWLLRFARIYPIHLIVIAILIFLKAPNYLDENLPLGSLISSAAATAALFQAWVPAWIPLWSWPTWTISQRSEGEGVNSTQLAARTYYFHPQVNEAYSKFFPTNPPARACFAVKTLPKNGFAYKFTKNGLCMFGSYLYLFRSRWNRGSGFGGVNQGRCFGVVGVAMRDKTDLATVLRSNAEELGTSVIHNIIIIVQI